MTGEPRSATVTALMETTIFEVNKQSFRGIISAQPGLVEQLGVALRVRLAERDQAIAGVERKLPDERDILKRIHDFFSM